MVVNQNTVSVNEDEEQLLSDYMTTYYTALANLSTEDLLQYYSDETESSINGMIDQTALDFLIDLRQMQTTDLRINSWECGMTYTGRETTGSETKITFLENNALAFEELDGEVSESSGIEHVFTLKEENGTLKIVSHEREEDGYLLVQEMAEEKGLATDSAQAKEQLDAIRTALLDEAQQAMDQQQQEKENQKDTTKKADKTYNREDAVTYANTWVDDETVIRNDEWGIYDIYGGNCNNFISQCLFAGGIPMDYIGQEQWKWYDDSIDTWQEPYGRSTSWTGVDDFYDYAANNTGYGLVADTSLGVYDGDIGDILQYGANGEWEHSVIITGVLTDETGAIQDYLINSNTTDRKNYPASAYAYADKRLIKIVGYNE